MLIGGEICPLATTARRIGMIEMRHHFSCATITGDPAEIMIIVLAAKARVAGKCGDAVGGDTARNGMAVVASRQGLAAAPHAIRELHAIAAGIAEAPMVAVAFDFQAGRSVVLARRQEAGL